MFLPILKECREYLSLFAYKTILIELKACIRIRNVQLISHQEGLISDLENKRRNPILQPWDFLLDQSSMLIGDAAEVDDLGLNLSKQSTGLDLNMVLPWKYLKANTIGKTTRTLSRKKIYHLRQFDRLGTPYLAGGHGDILCQDANSL